ncbi:MAG: 8-amino-7-oxononanoate synthase [Deltaproteobacteria bacterium]|nr:8-amino-7-oxononanoate synthase [Deltaproteobacteria bacterium]
MLDSYWKTKLALRDSQNLRRRLMPIQSPQGIHIQYQGRDLINFSSNDYLNLASDLRLKTAFKEGIEKWGVGSGASRLVCGSLQCFHDLEKKLAAFKGAEASLLFNSGYQANVGILSALLPQEGAIFSDELNHASMVDGIRLSKLKCFIFPHNDTQNLQEQLKRFRSKHPQVPILIATESVFSMEGDLCPLEEILNLAESFEAYVYLDEAHATGVFGKSGAGISESFRQHSAFSRLIQMGTLGKALGCFGAYVAGSQTLIDYLINQARTFIYATALPPALCLAVEAALKIVQEEPERRKKLWQNIEAFREIWGEKNPDQHLKCISPIISIPLGEPKLSLDLSQKLFEKGYWVTAIRPPTVPVGTSRLRVTLTSDHREEELKFLIHAIHS